MTRAGAAALVLLLSFVMLPPLAQAQSVALSQLLAQGYEIKAVNNATIFLQKGASLFVCVYNSSIRPVEAVAQQVRTAYCQAAN